MAIGNQTRPRIFDLNIRKPGQLYSTTVEVDERVTLVGYTSDPEHLAHAPQFDSAGNPEKGYTGPGIQNKLFEKGATIIRGLSGEPVHVVKALNKEIVRKQLQEVYDEGYRSIAVVFVHSYDISDIGKPRVLL